MNFKEVVYVDLTNRVNDIEKFNTHWFSTDNKIPYSTITLCRIENDIFSISYNLTPTNLERSLYMIKHLSNLREEVIAYLGG